MKRVIMLASILTAGIFASCHSEHKEAEENVEFLVTSPIKMDTVITKDYVCQIHAISHIELRAQERGFLQAIYIDEGQHVMKGQLLFQIMPNLYEAEVMSAKAEVEAAEIEVSNSQALYDKNVVSKNELAMAKAKLNKAKADVKVTESGLQYKILTEGTGEIPKAGQEVSVHYTGKLIDGTVFDSSIDRGEPAKFKTDQVIPGWTEALLMMPVGSKWELVIPSDLAYGSRATGPIPANATLVFEVELLEISK